MKLSYRPEIDGLRAIAVLTVIFYHSKITIMGFEPFKGGFIGVDIFFVISGYLITSIILKELEVEKKFSFINFYERRSRRILPVLLFIILSFLPFAWLYLLPSTFVEFSKSILYSLGFSSNFYFHFSGLEYGGVEAMYKPFLHTWSLSVEEQYYLIFPIFLYLVFKYVGKYMFQILFLLLISSYLLAELGSSNFISINFYFIQSRIWELLAGSLLAYLEIKKRISSNNKIMNEILPIIGLILIFSFVLLNDDKINHPSFKTFFPILGTCLFIWFSKKGTIHNKIISSKLFVGIGLISYSLYLWHYPILSFVRITEITQGNNLIKIFIFFIMILLSIFSYYFIEKPFRDKDRIKKKLFFLTICLTTTIIVIINLIIVKKEGFKSRIPDVIIKAVERHGKEKIWHRLKQDNKSCWGRTEKFCSFNSQNKDKIYLIGDSHFGTLMYDLNNQLSDKSYNFIPITNRGFFYFNNSIKSDRNEKVDNNYLILQKKINKIVSESQNNIFIFGGASSLYFFQKRYYFNNKISGDTQIKYVNEDDKKFNP